MRGPLSIAIALLLAGAAAWRIRSVQPMPGSPDGERSVTQAAEIPSQAPQTADAEPTAAAILDPNLLPDSPPDGDPDVFPAGDDDASAPGNTESAARPLPLLRLLASQNPDGSWGDRDEDFEGARYSRHSATALALLAFLRAGYTHLTKETLIIEGVVRCVGDEIKLGLKWLAANPADGPFDVALESLAWGEVWGLTNSKLYKGFAEKSYARLGELQDLAGSWGRESTTTSWAALAVKTAELGELAIPETIKVRASAWSAFRMESGASPQDATAWLLLTKERAEKTLAQARSAIGGNLPDWTRQDLSSCFLASQALPFLGDQGGTAIAMWSEAINATASAYADDAAGRPASDRGTAAVVRNALTQVTMEARYRYVEPETRMGR